MGGGVVVHVQLSCGGSYFVNYQMGSIFLNVLVCVKGKKKSVLVQNTARRYKASLLTPLLKLALC